jgi:hypothetical protein
LEHEDTNPNNDEEGHACARASPVLFFAVDVEASFFAEDVEFADESYDCVVT